MATKKDLGTLMDLGIKYKTDFEEASLGVREAVSEADEILCRQAANNEALRLDALYDVLEALGLFEDYDSAAEAVADAYECRRAEGAAQGERPGR